MTQIWENDRVIPVTPISAGPCPVVQLKTMEKDGYMAVQLAFGTKKEKNINKPQLGHFKKIGIKARFLKEFRVKEAPVANPGDLAKAEVFSVGDIVDVTGTSKGKGFQGVVKRHHFAGGRKSHGNKDQLRMPGSIGPKGPAHVFKGTRMAGRMGNARVTVTNLKIVKIDEENNIIYLQGAVPGAINGLLMIKGKGEMNFVNPATVKEVVTPEVVEEVKEEPIEEVPVVAEEVKTEEPVVEEPVAVEEVKQEEKEEAQAS